MKLFWICATYLISLFCFSRHIEAVTSSYDESKLCHVGRRVFIGNINESLPQYLRYNGIYVKQPSTASEALPPTYKHEARDDAYLYYLAPSAHLGSGRWVIGDRVGSTGAVLSSVAGSEIASRQWRVWSNESQTWTALKGFKSVCVAQEFVTCTSGRLELTANFNATRHHRQIKRLGVYSLIPTTNVLRPVYVNERMDEYIFHKSGMWHVGPDVTKASGGMFAMDGAWRPEYIMNDWIVQSVQGRTPYLAPESSVRVTCQLKAFKLRGAKVIRSNRTATVNTTVGVKKDTCDSKSAQMCGRNGRCLPLPSNSSLFHCHCENGLFGPKCRKRIRCRIPPVSIDGYTLQMSTGRSFLDLAFYACPPGSLVTKNVSPGIVCQYSGTWSEPLRPTCAPDSHRLTPEKPPT